MTCLILTIAFFPKPYTLLSTHMSFLFHKRTKKAINMVWGVVAVLVILGMVLFFAPGVYTALTS